MRKLTLLMSMLLCATYILPAQDSVGKEFTEEADLDYWSVDAMFGELGLWTFETCDDNGSYALFSYNLPELEEGDTVAGDFWFTEINLSDIVAYLASKIDDIKADLHLNLWVKTFGGAPNTNTRIVADFEGNEEELGYKAWKTGIGVEELDIIENPHKSGINTSDKVLKLVREGRDWRSGIRIDFDETIDAEGFNKLRYKIYSYTPKTSAFFRLYYPDYINMWEGWMNGDTMEDQEEWTYIELSLGNDLRGWPMNAFDKIGIDISDSWGVTSSEETAYIDDIEVVNERAESIGFGIEIASADGKVGASTENVSFGRASVNAANDWQWISIDLSEMDLNGNTPEEFFDISELKIAIASGMEYYNTNEVFKLGVQSIKLSNGPADMPGTDPCGNPVTTKTNEISIPDNNDFFYPNPANQIVNFRNKQSGSIINLSGRIVRTFSNTTKVSIGDLKSGIYIINTDNNQTGKLTVQ